ncbi:thiamine pyrophosphate-dependent dehydrogenase E1 component subunit alpha [Sorangium sp. So ce513]|uniref:thiamine pyrophosphate-dependent dehydrogenase E1 component subunit alpha n=1 Tax=Sorangium sp. So ce513 TaxID=3133315 RepID=UPI003F629413
MSELEATPPGATTRPAADAPPPHAPPTRAAEAAEGAAEDEGLLSVLRDDGTLDPATDPGLPDALLLRAFREIKRLRLLDARMLLLQRQGRIGFYGACTGQEATPIATALALEPGDWIFPALRESVMMLVRGFPLRSYVAQVFGNSGDVLKGRQMPSHMSGRRVNQVSWSSCIGPQVPQAVGAAWAAKLRRDSTVVVGFMGDGATSEPDFHSAMNFAGVFRVPCVLICQNNHWAISVPTERQTASRTIAIKGRAYGVPSVRVDGNDVLAVYRAVSGAVARARAGGGPTFIEALTYRVGAHSSSDDPSRYRSQEEVDRWTRRDPLLRLGRHLAARGLLDDAAEAALEAELNAEIAAAVAEVEGMDPPARETLFDDVYAELPWHLRDQRAELLRSPKAPAHGGR